MTVRVFELPRPPFAILNLAGCKNGSKTAGIGHSRTGPPLWPMPAGYSQVSSSVNPVAGLISARHFTSL